MSLRQQLKGSRPLKRPFPLPIVRKGGLHSKGVSESMERLDPDTVLEIAPADGNIEWHVRPERPTEYPIVIRNGTSESHDIEINVVEAIDWATITPARLGLRPGREATAQLVLAAGAETSTAAGEYPLTLELHDFEGTRLGQFTTSVYVVPYYRLEMSVRVRGPLLRRGLAEGFVLNCTVINCGNAECAVQPQSVDESAITLTSPTVRIPVGGNLSFDIEARWRSNTMQSYPATIRICTRYPRGEVVAEVPWADVVASLGSMMPPLVEEEGFPEIVDLKAATQEAPTEVEPMTPTTDGPPGRKRSEWPPADANPSANENSESDTSPSPLRVQIKPSREVRYTYGLRVNPWWPPAECFGGRWRLKAMPILTVVLIAGGLLAAAKFEAFHSHATITQARHPKNVVIHRTRSSSISMAHKMLSHHSEKQKARVSVVNPHRVRLSSSITMARIGLSAPVPKNLPLHRGSIPALAVLAAASPNVLRTMDQHQLPCDTETQETLASPASNSIGVSTAIRRITIVAAGNSNNLFRAHNQWILTIMDNTGTLWTGSVLQLTPDPNGPHPYSSDFFYSSNIPILDAGRKYQAFLSTLNGTCAPHPLGSFST